MEEVVMEAEAAVTMVTTAGVVATKPAVAGVAAKVVADSPLLRTLIEKHDEEKEEPPELPKVLIWEKQFGT